MSPLEGSTLIYKRLILPYFLKHESAIDDVVKKGSEKIAKLADSAIEKGAVPDSPVSSFEFLLEWNELIFKIIFTPLSLQPKTSLPNSN